MSREHSDQLKHKLGLIRVTDVRMKIDMVFSYQLIAQLNSLIDWMGAKADLSLPCMHTYFVSFAIA